MAFASTVIWEVEPGVGAASNGGGFDPVSGVPGTDYSQQAGPQITYTDLVIDAATNTNCTSVGHPFTSAHVGNIINITSGTVFTVQRVQVMSVAGGVATCDKSLGTLSSTGGNGKLGGALASLNTVSTLVVDGNKVWMKQGNDAVSGTVTFNDGTSALGIEVEGYYATRGDLTSTYSLLHTASGWLDTTKMPKYDVAGNTLAPGRFNRWSNVWIPQARSFAGVSVTGGAVCQWYSCSFSNTDTGANAKCLANANAYCFDCDFSTVTTSAGWCHSSNSGLLVGCRFTSTNGGGVDLIGSTVLAESLFYGFASGVSAVLLDSGSGTFVVRNCTFFNCLGNAVAAANIAWTPASGFIWLYNNQATGGGTFANNLRSGTTRIPVRSFNNRIRNNTHTYLGWKNVTDDGTATGDVTTAQTDAQEYVAPTATPPDLHLLTASYGKGAGFPAYLDTGAWQRREPVAAGYPAIVNVRNGISYGDADNGTLTGTCYVPARTDVRTGVLVESGGTVGLCAVPLAAQVLIGVAVDATTGTAAIDATTMANAVWDAPFASHTTAGTFGRFVRAIGRMLGVA